MPIIDLQCLWAQPEQAGFLKKRSHKKRIAGFSERFFLLKGSYLFYFKNRHSVKSLQGVVPLENAKVESEAPLESGKKMEAGHYITITLHVTHAYSAKHPYYILTAPSSDVQQAWCNALWQAAVPRGSLISHLQKANRLADVVAEYATQLQLCYPTADAAVLSSSGRARLSGIGNVGELAAALRRQKLPGPVQDMGRPLPTVPNSLSPEPPTILARTESGSVVPASLTPPPAPPATKPAAPQTKQEPKGAPPSRLSVQAASGPAGAGQKGAQEQAVPPAEVALREVGVQQEKARAGMDGAVPAAIVKATT